MSIKEKAIKGILWSAVQSWGNQAGSLIVFFVLARLLSPEAFGLVALANIFLAFMQIFLNQGFAQVIVQRQDLEPEHLDTAFWTNLAIALVLASVSLSTAGVVAGWFQQPLLTPILQSFSLLFLITAFGNVQQALLERKLEFKAIAGRWLAGTVIGGVVGITLALYGFGVWSLVGQQIVHEFVGAIVLWWCSRWRPRLMFSLPHFQHLFKFGISILGFNVLSFLNTRADDFLIGYFLGPVALGYYSLAYRILGVLTQLLVNTSKQVSLPTFSRLQDDLDQFRRAFYAATQLTSLVAFPIFLGVAILASELVVLIFGTQWLQSIPVLQVLCFAGIFQAVSFFKSSVFIAMGKPSWALWLGLLTTTLNLIGFAIAVPWGIVAVASAFVLRGYIVFPIGQWAVSRLIHIPLSIYLKQFIAPLGSALIMAIAMMVSKFLVQGWMSPLAILVLCSTIGTAVYAASIWLLAPQLFRKLMELIQLALTRSKRQRA